MLTIFSWEEMMWTVSDGDVTSGTVDTKELCHRCVSLVVLMPGSYVSDPPPTG